MKLLKIAMCLILMISAAGVCSRAEAPSFEIKLTDSIIITAKDIDDVLIEYTEDNKPYILMVLSQEAKNRVLRGNLQITGDFTIAEAITLVDDIQASAFGETSKYDDD